MHIQQNHGSFFASVSPSVNMSHTYNRKKKRKRKKNVVSVPQMKDSFKSQELCI